MRDPFPLNDGEIAASAVSAILETTHQLLQVDGADDNPFASKGPLSSLLPSQAVAVAIVLLFKHSMMV